MDRRIALTGLIAATMATATPAVAARAVQKNQVTWTVPDNVYKVRVQRWHGGDRNLDTYLDVQPGDVFQLDVVKQ